MKSALYLVTWFAVAASGAFGLGQWIVSERSAQPDKSDRAYMEDVVKNYIGANPDLVGNAIRELLKRQEAAKAAEQARLISSERNVLFDLSQQTVLGSPDADTTLFEFFDYNCPHCRNESDLLERLLQADSRIRVVLKEFPILGEASMEAARVSLAVATAAPGRYHEFQYKLLHERGQIDAGRALEVAALLGIPKDKLVAIKDSREIDAAINQNLALGRTLGVSGTPSFVTSNEVLIGELDLDVLKAKLAKVQSSANAGQR